MRYLRLVALAVLAVAFLASSLAAQAASTAAASVSPEMPADIQRLYGAGRYREAVEALQAAAAADGTKAPLDYWLGRSFYELRDFSRSISSFERAVALDPGRSEYHEWLGRACGRKAEETNIFSTFSSLALARRTSREFATAVRLDAGNLVAQRDYIRYLLNAPGIVGGSDEHAEEQIRALAQLDPVEGDLAQAESLATHKKYDEANQKYLQILAIKHTRVGVYLEVADYYCGFGDAAHVEQAVEAAAQASPDDPRLHYYRGVALVLAEKDPGRAAEELHTYLTVVPDGADVPPQASAHEWLARLDEKQGKRDQAILEYQAGLALDPHNKSLRDGLKRLEK